MSEQRTEQDSSVLERKSIPTGSSKGLSEIRIVLIGGRELGGIEASGKSSSGNIILGRDAFVVGRRTARSVQATGEVHGRQVTVVDTPGWWWHYSVENTPAFDRLEIMKSPTLCPPGPHAFLLVIPVDSVFPDIYRLALEEHLEIFSEDLWRHTIVLFSSIGPYDDRALNNNLTKWPDLQWLVGKCQNRYYILDIKNEDNSSQVTTLLEKIDEMAAQNNGHYSKISKSIQVSAWDVKITRERASQRILNVKKRRTELQERIRNEKQHLNEIRIVILGASWAARSSAGNVVLGEEAFKVDESRTTVRCAVSHAEIDRRQLTVVDTPGWYYNHPLEKTPEIDKLEIRRSVYLCPPGPHAILVTVPIATAFNQSYKIAVQEHMGLLGKEVWRHTIVLFTRGDWLGDSTIEERIEKEGLLEWLMKQCENKYHVLNCKNPIDTTQVTELLEKIEEMVMGNNGCYYVPEIVSDPSNDLQLKLKTAKTNMLKVNRQKDILQELLKERKYDLSELRIVLLGAKESGKTMVGNFILQRYLFKDMSGEDYKIHPMKCTMQQRKVEGCKISVVDTPGWSTSTLENTKEILRSVTVCSPGPHAFLLVLPVHESFTQKAQQSVEELMRLFGERVWDHTVILFYGHWLRNRPAEQYIACEGEALQDLIRKCGNRYHVLVDDWSNRSQVKIMLKTIQVMVTRNRGEYFILEKKEGKSSTTVYQWLSWKKMLTEEEWNKREDELIERVLKAVIVDLDEESKQPSRNRRGSIDHPIPSLSGDSSSDGSSVYGGDYQNPTDRVSQWLRHPRYHATSSGYDTMNTISSSQDPNTESLRDEISMSRQHPTDMDTHKYVSNMRAQKHVRSSSI